MRILLTGGAGYIGSHTAIALLSRGDEVVVLDDFSNSNPEAIRRVEHLTGERITVVEADLSRMQAAVTGLRDIEFDAVIHLAGLKAVGESVASPTHYYRNNLASTINLLDVIQERGVHKLVFSSSATVYGLAEASRISEEHPVGVGLTSPYGWTKVMCEQIIRDAQRARPELEAVLLRYFNPVGAHPSGEIGEDPHGIPNNLMPFVAQVAAGRRDHLEVFGKSYPTSDGTGVRDYIHVMDLADGHLAALDSLRQGVETYNLGSGRGSSVLDVVRMFSDASGRDIPYTFVDARAGDVASAVADPSKANRQLGWSTKRTLEDACRDVWRWQSKNPTGLVATK